MNKQDQINAAYVQMTQNELLGALFLAVKKLEHPGAIKGVASVGAYLTTEWGNDADCDRETLEGQDESERLDFEAYTFTMEQMEKSFMDGLVNGGRGADRRTAFDFLTRSSDDLYSNVTSEDEGRIFSESVHLLQVYSDCLRDHLDMIEEARGRMISVLRHNFPNKGF